MGLPFRVMRPPGLLALSVVAAALAGIIGLELREGTLDEALVPAAPTTQQAERPPVSVEVPGDQAAQHVAIILARPLFNPSRRPPDAAKTTGLVRLTGVLMSPAGKSAIFAGPAGGKPVIVGEGAHIGEYVVNSIDADAVTVIGPEGQRVLHPAFDPSPPSPPKQAVKQAVPAPITPPTPLPPVQPRQR